MIMEVEVVKTNKFIFQIESVDSHRPQNYSFIPYRISPIISLKNTQIISPSGCISLKYITHLLIEISVYYK